MQKIGDNTVARSDRRSVLLRERSPIIEINYFELRFYLRESDSALEILSSDGRFELQYYPKSSFKIASVSSPKSGAAQEGLASVSENFKGTPILFNFPAVGCSVSIII